MARGRGWRGRGQPNVGIAKRVMQQALSEKATEPRRGRGRRGRGRLVSSGQESDSMQLTMTQTQGVRRLMCACMCVPVAYNHHNYMSNLCESVCPLGGL